MLRERYQKFVLQNINKDQGHSTDYVDFLGIHSREWVAPAMATYLIHRLATDPDAIQIRGILDGVDWYILPVVNPDGYEYSRSSANVSISMFFGRI